MTGTNPDGIPADGIDPDDLETCLRVLDRAAALGEELVDLPVGVHHRRVVAVAELGADLGQ